MEDKNLNRKLKKQIVYILALAILIPTLSESFNRIMFLSTNKTCGYFYKIGTSRYVDYYHYVYKVNGEEHTGSISKGHLKITSLDDLKKIGCIKLEYSNYLNLYSRVVDSRVLR